MTKTIKTELTRDEVAILLDVYNTIDAMVDDTMELMDVRMSLLNDVREKSYALKSMFDFRPLVDSNGNPNHWRPYVLPDNPNAWFYEKEETA